MAVLLLTDRGFERNRLLRDPHDFPYLINRHIQLQRDFLRHRLMPVLVQELARNLLDLVNGLHHMDRDPDGARLIGDRTGDGLADPPGGIGGKFEALGVIELLHRLDQAEIPLLNEVKELHPPADIPFGNADDQPEVCLAQTLFAYSSPFMIRMASSISSSEESRGTRPISLR